MPPIKPQFPNPSTPALEKSLERLGDAIENVRGPDGSIDLQKLEQKIDTAGDRGMELGLDAIRDRFQRTEMRTFHDGCSGGTVTREVRVPPKSLDSTEVGSVLQAIIAAKAKIGTLDKNADGKISQLEAKAAKALTDLAGQLASGALDGSLTAYRLELRHWNEAVNHVADSIDDRKELDSRLRHVAEWHAESDEGAAAITWAYRDLATRGKKADIWELGETLEKAETSFLRWIPFFGRNEAKKKGHLSDQEVKRLLGTSDLAAFAASKKAEIETRVGGGYEAHYLAGKDLAGADALADADFRRVRSSC